MIPEQILIEQASLQRNLRARSLLSQQSEENHRSSFSATLLGFDAATGLYNCQLEDSTIVKARSIASSGSSGSGAIVALYKPQTGLPIIKWL